MSGAPSVSAGNPFIPQTFAVAVKATRHSPEGDIVTKKMQATSIGELIRIWELLPVAMREERSP